MSRLELTTFGVPHIQLDGRSVAQLSSRKAQALLIYLATTRQQHSRQVLAGLLWGEMSEAKARRNLRVTLTRIRQPLEAHLIIRRRSLRINYANDVWLDVDEFEACLTPANPSLDQLQRAATLYRGHFLDDFVLRDAPLFEEWIRPLQERYRQMAMEAMYRLAQYHTEQKQYSTAITHANRLLRLEPWMEEAHRQLMLLLALSGQRSAALAQYESCCAMLLAELGVEPAAATVNLYEQILREEIQPDTQTISIEVRPSVQAAPVQIPAAVKYFVGRSAEATALAQTLCAEASQPVQALVGMGGIGKSSLAIQLARAVQKEFPDGILWATAASSEPMAILESWAAAYDYDFSRIADLESMAAAFRGVLAEKRVLIVLDDVTSVSRIRPLLPGGAQCRVLLTTRDQDLARALNAQVWPLRELSPENGRLLLSAILGQKRVAAEAEAADEICALLQNLPLALEITAQRLKSRPRRLAEMARRLRDETQRLSLLKISDREVRASFAVSWEALDAERRRIFALIGLFNGRSFTAEAMAHIAAMERYPLEDRLFDLVNLSLLREEAGRRYRQHALLADFAREQLGDDAAEEYGRFAGYYLHFAQQNQHDYDALRPEWDNLMAAMAAAHAHQLWQTVIDFADALHDAWFTRGRFTQARIGFELAHHASKTIGQVHVQADSLFEWGKVCIEQRDYKEAERNLIQSLDTYKFLGSAEEMAKAQLELAKLSLETANYDKSQDYVNASRHYWEEHDDKIGQAETLYTEARIHYFCGNYDETEYLAKKAWTIQKVQNDKRGMILTLNLLASTANELKKFDKAESFGLQALALCRELHDKAEQAMILDVLAGAYMGQSKYAPAIECAQKSLELLEGMGDMRSQAQVLFRLCLIKKSQEAYQESLDMAYKSLALCQNLQYTLLWVSVLLSIGDLHLCLDRPDQAQEGWKQAFELSQSLDHPRLAEALQSRLEQ